MRRTIGTMTIECVEGDITKQPDVDAIVNAANSDLLPGGGVAGAIHAAAGPDLERACQLLAPIEPGDAVITAAFALPNRHVIHCLGPVFGEDVPSDRLLALCYANALRLAEENRIASIAFPAISTGIFGYPIDEAAEVAISTVAARATSLRVVRLVRFVLWGRDALAAHTGALERFAADGST